VACYTDKQIETLRLFKPVDSWTWLNYDVRDGLIAEIQKNKAQKPLNLTKMPTMAIKGMVDPRQRKKKR